MKKIFHYIIIATVALVMVGCSTIDCDLEGRILCHYTFKDVNGDSTQIIKPLSVIFLRDSLYGDTVFINQQTNVSSLDIPMSNVADMDRIALQVVADSATTLCDTVCISKTNTPTFEDVDCTARYRHEITAASCTHNFLDTLIINNSKVSNDASVTNIIIRLRSANQ